MGSPLAPRRCSGIPLLSCALVVLLPAPAALASAPGPRTAPRAVSSPGPYGATDPGAVWKDRLSGRLPGTLGDRAGHGPHGLRVPLPPLFGHDGHDGHDGHHGTDAGHGGRADQHRAGGEGDVPGSDGRSDDPSGRDPAAGTADGTRVLGGDTGTRPRTDARDASGGDSSPAPTPSADASGGAGEQAGRWSPAPLVSQPPERTVAGAAEPAPQEALPGGDTAGGAQAAPGPAAPASAAGPTGPILPVLPLGTGLASLGLGLAFLALRLRRG